MGYHEKRENPDDLCKKYVVDHRQANVERLLSQLSTNDAVYLSDLSASLASKRAIVYTDEEIYNILRFMVLARTNRCAKDTVSAHAAQSICHGHTGQEQVCIVLDLAAKSLQHSVLAQNHADHQVFGTLSTFGNVIGLRIDLFRVLLAIGGAYHQPGVTFTVQQQELYCCLETTRKFDMNYLVDVNSCVLVMNGCPSL